VVGMVFLLRVLRPWCSDSISHRHEAGCKRRSSVPCRHRITGLQYPGVPSGLFCKWLGCVVFVFQVVWRRFSNTGAYGPCGVGKRRSPLSRIDSYPVLQRAIVPRQLPSVRMVLLVRVFQVVRHGQSDANAFGPRGGCKWRIAVSGHDPIAGVQHASVPH